MGSTRNWTTVSKNLILLPDVHNKLLQKLLFLPFLPNRLIVSKFYWGSALKYMYLYYYTKYIIIQYMIMILCIWRWNDNITSEISHTYRWSTKLKRPSNVCRVMNSVVGDESIKSLLVGILVGCKRPMATKHSLPDPWSSLLLVLPPGPASLLLTTTPAGICMSSSSQFCNWLSFC